MARKRKRRSRPDEEVQIISDADIEPDWEGKCMVCDASPVVPATGMCGPCTFGEADTVAGNW